MQINKRTDQNIVILEPVGDIGLYNLGELRNMLNDLRQTGSLKVIIHMGKVPGIDSITIGFLLQETELFISAGGTLKLAGLLPGVRKSLLVTETLTQLDAYDDVQAALVSFRP